MRLRQLVLACGFSSFVLSQYASALGLGEVKLKSTLNQPLNAEVKLLDTRDLTADQILVALASPADFERNNVDRLYFYTEFQFEVVLNAADGPKVLITTRNPVREPYLNFLIEARWTAGRLLREYTVLMDLPTFEQDAGDVAAQPARASSKPSPEPARTSSATSPSRASSVNTESAPARTSSPKVSPTISGDQYEVRSNDTLWEIALNARSDGSVSVHQAMMALYQANPDAFINGNINMLRRGQVLRVPSADEMKSLSKNDAVSQFAQASTGDSSLGAQLNASRRTTAARSESTEVSGRVKLAAPSASSGGAGLGSGANDGAGKALEAELAATLEELDKSKAENTELSSRVKDLEAQINTMQRLVDVSNEKLRSLQVAANQQKAATETKAAEPPVVVDTPVVEPVSQAESSVADKAAVAVVASEAAKSSAAVSSAPAQPKKIIPPPAPQPTATDTLVANAPWIGLGVLGLAGAGYFFYRRRKQQELEQDSEQQDVFDMAAVDDRQDQYIDDVAEDVVPEETFDAPEEEAPAIAETGDVVGEADIYIAYGKLDQAEEMLLNGLQKDPQSVDIRMKLLEVYSQQQNASGFDKHYAALLPLAAGAVLARAAELRDHIDGAGEFTADSSSALPHEESALDDFALDDFQLAEDTSASGHGSELTNEADTGYDLDLSDEFASLDDVGSPTDTVIRKSSGYEPELDLDASSLDAADDEFTLDLGDVGTDLSLDLDAENGADDLSELSLALDDLDADVMPQDVTVSTPALEEEFSFDFEDDVVAEVEEPLEESAEMLDVAADDFNLDLDAGGVDLAALDHEMESLDVDFDEDGDLGESAPVPSFEAGLDDDFADLDAAFAEEDTDSSLGALPEESVAIDMSDDDLTLELDDSDDLSLDEMEVDLGSLESNDAAAFSASDELGVLDDDLASLDSLDDAIPLAESVAEKTEIAEDDVFSEALSDFSNDSSDFNVDNFSSEAVDLSDDDMDAELDFLADADEAATKLDLARAYIDMGDTEGAKDILAEVVHEGNDEQRKDAIDLLGRIDV